MKLSKSTALVFVVLALWGCNTGLRDTADTTDTPPNPDPSTTVTGVVVGRITAFGSVFVNGTEFDTSKTTFNVRGASAPDPTSLSAGMVVRIAGSFDSNGRGTASDVRYDAEIEGPASAVTVDPTDSTIKRFSVLGQDVLASATTVFEGDGAPYAFADLANGDHVEVSGDFSGGVLMATFIARKAATDTTYQVKGTVSQLSGGRFTLTLSSRRTLRITLAAGATFPAGVANNAFVQLQGTIPDPTKPTEFRASAVAIEDDDDFDGRTTTEQEPHADLGGVLSLSGTTWSVRGTPLKFSATTQYRPAELAAAITDKTAAGLRVHLKGAVVGGTLNVEQIRADGRANGAGDLKVSGVVTTILPESGGGTLLGISFASGMATIAAHVAADTLLMNDAADGPVLKSLQPGVSFVEVRGHLGPGRTFLTSALRVDAGPGKNELSGPVDAGGFVAGASISVLGVKFNMDASTTVVGGTPVEGSYVDITDPDRDGFAEVVELEGAPFASDFAPP